MMTDTALITSLTDRTRAVFVILAMGRSAAKDTSVMKRKTKLLQLQNMVVRINQTLVTSSTARWIHISCAPVQVTSLFMASRRHIWPTTVNWSPTPVAAGYDRLASTHASYLWRTPGSQTGALLSPVHGFGTLYQWNSISRTLNLLHFGGCYKPICLSVTLAHSDFRFHCAI